MPPSKLTIRVWNDKLTELMKDIDDAYGGDHQTGMLPLQMAVYLAWRELQAEIRRLEDAVGNGPVRMPLELSVEEGADS